MMTSKEIKFSLMILRLGQHQQWNLGLTAAICADESEASQPSSCSWGIVSIRVWHGHSRRNDQVWLIVFNVMASRIYWSICQRYLKKKSNVTCFTWYSYSWSTYWAVRNALSNTSSFLSTILEAPVTDQEFSDQLLNLEQKITFLKEQSFRGEWAKMLNENTINNTIRIVFNNNFFAEARSCNDVRDVVEKLKIKSIAKIREYMLERINQFKKPMANYHIPQNAMVKFK